MWQLILKQNTIRFILGPINLILAIACITITAVLEKKLNIDGGNSWGDYIFWLLKPSLQVQLMMTCIILLVGLSGNIRYNKCWQGSYAFFTAILAIVYIFTYKFAVGINYSLDNTFKTLIEEKAYVGSIYGIYSNLHTLGYNETNCTCEKRNISNIPVCNDSSFKNAHNMNCSTYMANKTEIFYTDVGARKMIEQNLTTTRITQMKNISVTGTILIVFYAIFLTVFAIFVTEESQASQSYSAAQ